LENACAHVRLNYDVLWDCFWLCMRGIVARTDIPIQASSSRLGEARVVKAHPGFLLELSI